MSPGQDFLKVQGTDIVDGGGNIVILKGVRTVNQSNFQCLHKRLLTLLGGHWRPPEHGEFHNRLPGP
jgi:hypothetical protein